MLGQLDAASELIQRCEPPNRTISRCCSLPIWPSVAATRRCRASVQRGGREALRTSSPYRPLFNSGRVAGGRRSVRPPARQPTPSQSDRGLAASISREHAGERSRCGVRSGLGDRACSVHRGHAFASPCRNWFASDGSSMRSPSLPTGQPRIRWTRIGSSQPERSLDSAGVLEAANFYDRLNSIPSIANDPTQVAQTAGLVLDAGCGPASGSPKHSCVGLSG